MSVYACGVWGGWGGGQPSVGGGAGLVCEMGNLPAATCRCYMPAVHSVCGVGDSCWLSVSQVQGLAGVGFLAY